MGTISGIYNPNLLQRSRDSSKVRAPLSAYSNVWMQKVRFQLSLEFRTSQKISRKSLWRRLLLEIRVISYMFHVRPQDCLVISSDGQNDLIPRWHKILGVLVDIDEILENLKYGNTNLITGMCYAKKSLMKCFISGVGNFCSDIADFVGYCHRHATVCIDESTDAEKNLCFRRNI